MKPWLTYALGVFIGGWFGYSVGLFLKKEDVPDIPPPGIVVSGVFDRDYPAEVIRVVDGDTVDLMVELGFGIVARKRIRIAGVDAPELPTEEGKAAANVVRSWLLTREVRLRTNKDSLDKYGRQLGDIWVDGFSVSERLIAEGHAKPYDR